MGFTGFKVQLSQKRENAIAELMAIGYDRNEAVEIVDFHDVNSAHRPADEVDAYEGTDEMGAY